jgi:hypothetical protein
MKLAKFFIIFTFLLAFAFQVSAQANSYPYELRGYEFFDKENLKKLRLGVSTKQNVTEIFGENCEDLCNYNQNWIINFTYFDQIEKGGVRKEKTYVPVSRYLGKLYSISLRPKLKISFKKTVFPSRFKYSTGGSRGIYKTRGSGDNGVIIYYIAYSDKYGLEYRIFNEMTLTKYKNRSKWEKGSLLSIEYQIPEKLEKTMFVEK